jgi:hypothetical protein
MLIMKNFSRSLVMILLLAPTFALASATALVDRDQISLSEAINVEISTDKNIQQSPDLAPLKTDFDIASTGKTVAVEMINGKIKQETRWVVSLIPKHAGVVTIPAITIGSEKTKPIQITVLNKPIIQPHSDDFFIESTINPKEVYWQQPLLYTLRIWASKPLVNIQFTQPSVSAGATITSIDKQSSSMRSQGGRQYEVVEKNYLITPDKVGALTIHPASLRGVSIDNRYPRQFIMGGDQQNVHFSGQELSLTVKAKPASWQGAWWLPANHLTIKEEWSQDIKNWKVGTPITRTIVVQGKGISAEQLPDIKMDSLSGINFYPDKTESNNALDHYTVVGTRQMKMALVPTQAGQWQLPAIKIAWWNVNTHKTEVAELPAVNLSILPESGVKPTVTTPSIQPQEKNLPESPSIMSTEKSHQAEPFWRWSVLILSSLLLFSVIVIAWLWKKLRLKNNSRVADSITQPKMTENLNQAVAAIKQASSENNPRATINATLHWARLRWPDFEMRSLDDVANLIQQPEFSEQVSHLLAACYSSAKQKWNAKEFWQIFERYALSTNGKKERADDPLPTLYP